MFNKLETMFSDFEEDPMVSSEISFYVESSSMKDTSLNVSAPSLSFPSFVSEIMAAEGKNSFF